MMLFALIVLTTLAVASPTGEADRQSQTQAVVALDHWLIRRLDKELVLFKFNIFFRSSHA